MQGDVYQPQEDIEKVDSSGPAGGLTVEEFNRQTELLSLVVPTVCLTSFPVRFLATYVWPDYFPMAMVYIYASVSGCALCALVSLLEPSWTRSCDVQHSTAMVVTSVPRARLPF
jgi:hypothetical protein